MRTNEYCFVHSACDRWRTVILSHVPHRWHHSSRIPCIHHTMTRLWPDYRDDSQTTLNFVHKLRFAFDALQLHFNDRAPVNGSRYLLQFAKIFLNAFKLISEEFGGASLTQTALNMDWLLVGKQWGEWTFSLIANSILLETIIIIGHINDTKIVTTARCTHMFIDLDLERCAALKYFKRFLTI